MTLFFLVVLVTVLLQRLLELLIARRNTAYIRKQGGFEVGAEHYKYIVALHVAFFLSLLAEVWSAQRPLPAYWYVPFAIFLLVQAGRYWCIYSLGRFWNTRILILPGAPRVTRGPYRYLRHPNYWIVTIELLTLPLTFAAYVTAFVFPVVNLWLLWRVRIPAEEQGLRQLAENRSPHSKDP